MVLQKLQPDTPYAVTVAAVYASSVSPDISGEGKTSKSSEWTCWTEISLNTFISTN